MMTPLVAGETVLAAEREEPLDLLVDSADRLDAAVLVDGARDPDAPVDRDVRERPTAARAAPGSTPSRPRRAG